MDVVRPVILLVENDDADVFLFRRALERLGFRGTLRVARAIAQAHDYLKRKGEFTDETYYPMPDLIVSDMNLHGPTGIDFLRWLQRQRGLPKIPFVFLSGSYTPPQRTTAEQLNPKAFYAKTGDIKEMVEHVRGILEFLPP